MSGPAPHWYRSNFKQSKWHSIDEITVLPTVTAMKAACGDSIGVPPDDPGAVLTRSSTPETERQCKRCREAIS